MKEKWRVRVGEAGRRGEVLGPLRPIRAIDSDSQLKLYPKATHFAWIDYGWTSYDTRDEGGPHPVGPLPGNARFCLKDMVPEGKVVVHRSEYTELLPRGRSPYIGLRESEP